MNSKRTLTDADIELLREVFHDKQASDDRMREIVREETAHLPSREEFLEETLKIYKKQEDLEAEKDILSHRVSVHSDQIGTIAEKVGVDIDNIN